MSRRASPPDVLAELREAIRPEVDACLDERVRLWRIQTWVLYALVFVALVGVAGVGGVVVRDIRETAATSREVAAESRKVAAETRRLAGVNRQTIEQLCTVARQQRRTLTLQRKNIVAYFKSPAGRERTTFNDYIRKFSLPQLAERLKTEQVPPACRG